MNPFSRVVGYFLPPAALAIPADERYRGRILVISCAVAFVLILPFLAIRIAAHGVGSLYVWLLWLALAGVAGAPLLYRWWRSVIASGLFVICLESVVLVAYAVIDGGLYSASILWFPILPVFTVFYAGWRYGVTVCLMLTASLGGILAGQWMGWFQPTDSPGLHLAIWGLSAVSVLVLLMFLAWAYVEWQGHIQGELISASESREHFLSTVSHELRTPLNAIVGLSALLRKGNAGALSRDQADYVADISASADQLVKLVNEVLEYSRVSSREAGIRRVPSDICVLLPAWVAPFTLESQQRNVELRTRASASACAAPVWIDPERFRQAVFNLITNALKFTPSGGRISIGAESEAGWLNVWVEDTGIGIPREEIARVFDDFYQTQHSQKVLSTLGPGLGLAVTRRIAALHGGTIEAASEGPGRGSRFVIRVPARPPAEASPKPSMVFRPA